MRCHVTNTSTYLEFTLPLFQTVVFQLERGIPAQISPVLPNAWNSFRSNLGTLPKLLALTLRRFGPKHIRDQFNIPHLAFDYNIPFHPNCLPCTNTFLFLSCPKQKQSASRWWHRTPYDPPLSSVHDACLLVCAHACQEFASFSLAYTQTFAVARSTFQNCYSANLYFNLVVISF